MAIDKLKPGVGDKVIAKLQANDEFIDLMVAAIVDGLKADVPVFLKGEAVAASKADPRARLEAFKLAMSYAEGLPLQRIIQQNLNSNATQTLEELEAAALASPAFFRALERVVDRVRATLRNAKPAGEGGLAVTG